MSKLNEGRFSRRCKLDDRCRRFLLLGKEALRISRFAECDNAMHARVSRTIRRRFRRADECYGLFMALSPEACSFSLASISVD